MFMVQFTSGEGRPSHHVSDLLEDAVRFIERLTNSEGVNDARLFEMTEIPVEVKAYYQVQVAPYAGSGFPSGASKLEVGPGTTLPAEPETDEFARDLN